MVRHARLHHPDVDLIDCLRRTDGHSIVARPVDEYYVIRKMLRTTSRFPYSCNRCKRIFQARSAVLEHIDKDHGDTSWKMPDGAVPPRRNRDGGISQHATRLHLDTLALYFMDDPGLPGKNKRQIKNAKKVPQVPQVPSSGAQTHPFVTAMGTEATSLVKVFMLSLIHI